MLLRTIPQLYEDYLAAGQKITTDTRTLEKGAIFFALKGPNFNANALAAKAIEMGCACAVVDEEAYANGRNIFLVQNVLSALQDLARHHRSTLRIPVLGITGSNGKTTHKELIAAVLSKKYNVLATRGNLNNHIGVPLTILSITPAHSFAVVEMGANHQGEIAELCTIADPDYGLITNIGKAHLEGFGGMEGVKKGKGELFAYLKIKNGKAFVNGDDEVLYQMAFNNDKITYGFRKLYDVIGKDQSTGEKVGFKFTTRYGEKDFNKLPTLVTRIVGHYNLINCLAAVCVGTYFKIEETQIREALSRYVPDMNRSQLVKTAHNTIILDAYNANPNSMRAALENFAKYPGENRVTLLGDMFELGEFSAAEHAQVIELLKQLKFQKVYLVGDAFSKLADQGFVTFRTTEDCRRHLEQEKLQGCTILIKGSRGMKMEMLQEVL